MRKATWLGVLGALLLAGVVLFAVWRPNNPHTVTIGASLPLTGDAAVYGRAIKQGMDLAVDEIRRNKGMDLDIIYEDDQGKPTSSVSSVNKLLTVDQVAVIVGGAMSSTAEPIIPLTERREVVLISPTATKASLTDNTHYFFRLWPSDNYDGRIMAELAYNRLELRRVAVLYVNVAYGLGIADVFKREFEALGGTIVAFEGYAQNATDFRTQIEKLRASRPDAVYIPGYVKEVANLLRQAKELDFKPQFLGVNSLHDPALLDTAGDSAEGAVFTCPTYDAGDSARPVADFVAAFRRKYGSEPDAFAAQGYDTVRVIAEAISLSGGTSAAQVRQGLLRIKDYSGPGGKITFESNGDVQKPLRLLTVKKRRFAPL